MLHAIRGHAELLADDLSDPRRRLDTDTLQSQIQAIESAAERATSLTGQLLAFGRRQVVAPKVLDVNAAIESVQPMLHRLIGENVRLNLRTDPSAGRIRIDPGQFDQILVNLVVNARDAMPDGGMVTIQTGNTEFDEAYAIEHFEVRVGRFVMLAVSDTGQGMDRETRQHVFEPFFTTKEIGKGTGLGLATIYGIVKQAGGTIWLYSEPGQGTMFKLYFPREDGVERREEAPVETLPGRVGGGRVLVVEDEPAVRKLTTMLLERAGLQVIAVSDGAEALAAIDRLTDPIDAMITDVLMPGITGVDLADRMLDRFPNVGIVLLSGYTEEVLDLERIRARGAVFIGKPVASNHLLDAVRRAMVEARARA